MNSRQARYGLGRFTDLTLVGQAAKEKQTFAVLLADAEIVRLTTAEAGLVSKGPGGAQSDKT